jgi:hypothetical protein
MSSTNNFLDMGKSKTQDNIVCIYEDETIFVSDLAIQQSDTVIHSLKPNRFDEKAMRVIRNVSYAMSLGNGQHECNIISGLPTSHYSKFKDNITKLFMPGTNVTQDYEVYVNGQRIKGSVKPCDGRFVPQPFGALIDEILDDNGSIADKELASLTVAIVDIGFGTTDIYVCNALTPVEKLSFSTTTALGQAYQLIADKISEKGTDLPLYKVEQVVQDGVWVGEGGKTYNMKSTIDWALQSTAEQLVSEIYNKWRNTNQVHAVRIAGGGGIRFSPYMLSEFSNTKTCHHGQFAVVKGYEKWGKRTWKDVV